MQYHRSYSDEAIASSFLNVYTRGPAGVPVGPCCPAPVHCVDVDEQSVVLLGKVKTNDDDDDDGDGKTADTTCTSCKCFLSLSVQSTQFCSLLFLLYCICDDE